MIWRLRLKLSRLYVLLLQHDKINYANVVWCNLSLPKHRFILWQAVLGHLLTRDKLLLRHVRIESPLCPVCELELETHDHLFFDCIYSQHIMHKIEEWLGVAIWPSKYGEWTAWMVGRPKGLLQRVLAAALAATVYFIWLNRNSCIFNCSAISSTRVYFLIKSCLKARMLGLARKHLGKKEKAIVECICHL
ncbi:uncharacterized protein LOC133791506 [Humulus lupulus]|uniref:uncharacterized protein LOC133791506 n=1 Tax=Humulus lupulus TaxID=3486 RepID=UPI002B4042F9|nr:uncharacterized protein LOC133791506 [Humulus lupulus]